MHLQWGVFLATLDPVVGAEQHGRRPVLVISREDANQILPVVTALPITSRKPRRRVYPNEHLLPAGVGGLTVESIVLGHQIRTLSKQRIAQALGTVDEGRHRAAIRDVLLYHLDLE